MTTRVLYTPSILHTLHTRPGIDSHMSREGTLTAYTSSRDVSRTVHNHKHTSTSKSVLPTRLTPPTSQNKLYDIKFDCVSSPVLVSFLYVVMCQDTQKQIRHGWITNECNLTRDSCITSLQSNNISTGVLYTPIILHTLHTRPGIHSHMSREGTLTH
jgi:hypothetical protein